MRKIVKLFGIISLVVLFVFSMAGCGGPLDGYDGYYDDNTGQQPGTQQPGGSGPVIAYSVDGITWTRVADSKLNNASFKKVVYGNGTWLALYSSAGLDSDRLAYSSDGISWTAVPDYLSIYGDYGIYDIAWGGGKFIAVGDRGRIAYSSNGVNWTNVTNTTFGNTHLIAHAAWGDGRFIAVGANRDTGNGVKYAYSTDGVTWLAGTGSFTSNTGGQVVWGNGIWVKNEEPCFDYSTDSGDTWKVAYVMDNSVFGASAGGGLYYFSGQIGNIVWGNGKFAAVGRRSSYNIHVIIQSLNGKDWSVVDDANLQGVVEIAAWGNNRFVGFGLDGRMPYSFDGINWTAANNNVFGVNGVIFDVAWGNGKFVAVGFRY
jgi:hypothetical protein